MESMRVNMAGATQYRSSNSATSMQRPRNNEAHSIESPPDRLAPPALLASSQASPVNKN
jgi:hypothetical protein